MLRRKLFLLLPFVGSISFSIVLITSINWQTTNIWFEVPWIAILTLLNCILFTITLGALFSFRSNVEQVLDLDDIQDKQAALLFSLKNESNLYDKIYFNIINNPDSIHEVIIISNSDKDRYLFEERQALARIQSEFGINTTHYPAQPPKHMGIYSLFSERDDLEYVAMCDADTLYSPGSIKALLRRAYHPANGKVAVWQSHSIANPGVTRFSRIMGEGQRICAKLYAHGFFMALGQSGYYGSGALVSRKLFAEAGRAITEHSPISANHIQSHDVWEATVLIKLGYDVRYVKNVETYEDFPQSYLEMIKRDKRWMKGSIQSYQSLQILPDRNTLVSYFFVFLPLVLYMVQPLYLFWIFLGVFRYFYTETTNYWLQVGMIAFTLGVVFLQKFLAARSFSDVLIIIREQIFSTIFYINTPVFTTLNILTLPIKDEWIPMTKQFKTNRFVTTINKLMVNEILGYWGLLFIWFNISPRAVVYFPIFFIFVISGIITYYFQFEADQKLEKHRLLETSKLDKTKKFAVNNEYYYQH